MNYATDAKSSVALDTANIVTLSRVIWIMPCTIFGAWIMHRGGNTQKPLKWSAMVERFIILFLVAIAIRTFVPEMTKAQDLIKSIAAPGFAGALFLIGAGLSLAAIMKWQA